MAISRRIERVPADQHGARPFVAVHQQQEIGEADNRARLPSTTAQDCFRQSVIGPVRERISIDREQRTDALTVIS